LYDPVIEERGKYMIRSTELNDTDKKNHLICGGGCRRGDLGKGILKKVSLADYLILNLRESIHPEKADLDLPKTLVNLWQPPVKKDPGNPPRPLS
jgi:hypothetical protein